MSSAPCMSMPAATPCDTPCPPVTLTACVKGLAEFEREALKPFLADWGEADALHGQPVNVTGGQGVSQGVAAGIDMHGALLIETPEGVQRFLSGDVSVRRV